MEKISDNIVDVVDKIYSSRFAAAPRNDPARPRRVRCLNPFRWLEVNQNGEVTPCCSSWFKGNLGNINERSLLDIWNGTRFRELRESMFEGGKWRKFCNEKVCPQILNDTWVSVDFISPTTPDQLPITQEMLQAIREGKTEMPFGPLQIGLTCDSRCNLCCIMCEAPRRAKSDGALIRKALEDMEPLLPSLKRIKLLGDGEPFFVPEVREFLFDFDSRKYPDARFLINTNGILFTPDMWDKIQHLKLDWVVVSIDAATKETYEEIRIGGDWDILQENLEFLAGKYKEGFIRELLISMTVMKSNHHELADFAKMGKRLGVTSTYFYPIYGDYGREQIFDRRDISCLKRISRQLSDPFMRQPGVDFNALNRWENWKPGWSDYAIIMKRVVKKFVSKLHKGHRGGGS
ncbi:SPASM domain-containing protein [Candidatus Sumerlaeota bacterium]|nr:SPASM domain-containing protein [Candidatus Sumerlaeota bacterium]